MPFTNNTRIIGTATTAPIGAWTGLVTLTQAATPPVSGTKITITPASSVGVTTNTISWYRTDNLVDDLETILANGLDGVDGYEEIINATTGFHLVSSVLVGATDPFFSIRAEDVGYRIFVKQTGNAGGLGALYSNLSDEAESGDAPATAPTFTPAYATIVQAGFSGGIGTVTVTLTSSFETVSAGFTLYALRIDSVSNPESYKYLATPWADLPGVTGGGQNVRPSAWTSSNGGAAGSTQYMHFYTKADAETEIIYAFTISVVIADTTVVVPEDPEDFPSPDTTLGSATLSALYAAVNARIATGSTSEYVIDCPAGSYGFINLANKVAPGRIIIRCAGLGTYAAKCTGGTMEKASNITLQFFAVDRTGLGPSGGGSAAWSTNGSSNCAFEYCDFYMGPTVRNQYAQGWVNYVQYAISTYGANGLTTGLRVHMNAFRGACAKGIYNNYAQYSQITENVFYQINGDSIYFSYRSDNSLCKNNWDARQKYPSWAPAPIYWDHNDFIQVTARTEAFQNFTCEGNVSLMGTWAASGLPNQGNFARFGWMQNCVYRDNIYCGNSQWGLDFGTDAAAQGNQFNNQIFNNTSLRIIDDTSTGQTSCYVSGGGLSAFGDNVMCAQAHETGAILGSTSNSLYILVSPSNFAASLTYYTSPRRTAAGIYALRPVEGQPTHWDYVAGTKKGAYARFDRIINDGEVPNIGAAATYWALQYGDIPS